MKGELIRCMLAYLQRRIAMYRDGMLVGLIIIFALSPFWSFSQEKPAYYEIPIFFNVQGVGGTEVPAVITDNNDVYLSVIDVFSFIRIRNSASPGFDSISGFFIDQSVEYLIDRVNNRIIIQDRIFELKYDDLILEETGLYMKTDVYGQVFGLVCTFDFRRLMVTLNTKLELPLIREMRQEQMRSNLRRLKGDVKADTNIGRSYPAFYFGMVDWSVYSTQTVKGLNDTRANLTLGGVLAGGETYVSLNYHNNAPFIENDQRYLWRLVKNDFKPLRQAFLGKIPFRSTSSIYEPVVGGMITNTPATYRRSFGSFTLADHTQPGWLVELYVNNVLVDYVQADASGFFEFQVPLVYGNSGITLRFYGPWGEERTEERHITIPFNFLPKKELEYTISGGVVEDKDLSRFSRSYLNYGLTNGITVGGGVEYLSSVTSGEVMPFVNSSIRIGGSLLLSGEYTYDVVGKGILSYQTPRNLFLELYYSRYSQDQTAVIFNYLEERKAVLSVPIRGKKFGAYSRLTLANQVIVPGKTWTRGELLFTGNFFGVNTNLTTYGIFSESNAPNIYSDLSLGFRFYRGLTIIPQVQYQYNQGEFVFLKCRLEKPLFRYGFLTATYEQNFRTDLRSFEVGFRYDFSFAQASLSVMQRDEKTHIFSSARGSLIFDKKSKYLGTHNRTSVGRGGLVILPFIDLNFNDVYDPGEPKVHSLNIRINGGRIERTDKDTTIRVFDLMPYTTYLLTLDKNSFDNIAWQLPFETVNIEMDANKLKRIEVPIKVMGEASGMVYMKKDGRKRGQSRIIVNFFSIDGTKVGSVLSEFDGYFSFLGMPTGDFYARVDTNQLNVLGMKSTPSLATFSIISDIDGDIVDNLEFTLSPKVIDTLEEMIPLLDTTEMIAVKDTTEIIAGADTAAVYIPVIEDLKGVFIQVGAFEDEKNALEIMASLKENLSRPVSVFVEDGYHKVRLTGFADREEAIGYVPVLVSKGFPEWYVIKHTGDAVALGVVVQVGKYQRKEDAVEAQRNLMAALGRPVMIAYENGKYVVRITGFENSREASLYIRDLITAGYPDAFVYGRIRERAPAGTVIQVGTFKTKSDAVLAQNILKELTQRPVIMIVEEGNYKLRVTGFASDEEAAGFIPEVISRGYTENYMINEQGEKIPVGAVVQVAAFERESTAFAARKKLSGITGRGRRALVMVEELAQPNDEHNKLRITGFADTNELKQVAPKLLSAGFPESQVSTATARNMLVKDLPLSTMQRKSYALQVRRPLPVLIVTEDGKSKVWIIGFSTIEEARKFMPELEAAGYPGAFIIKKPAKKSSRETIIEVGAFERREDAVQAQKKLVKVIGRYALITVEGLRPVNDQFNQVRISGFIDSTEMKQAWPGLLTEGFPVSSVESRVQVDMTDRPGIYVNPLQRQSFALPVTKNKVEIIREDGLNKLIIKGLPDQMQNGKFNSDIPFDVFIQAGSYRSKANALEAQQKLIEATGHPVVIVIEENIHKVRVTGFRDSLEASKMLSKISSLGYENPFILHERVNGER